MLKIFFRSFWILILQHKRVFVNRQHQKIFSGEKIYTDNRHVMNIIKGLCQKEYCFFNEFTHSEVWQNRKEKVR